jgi:hypothetical protein
LNILPLLEKDAKERQRHSQAKWGRTNAPPFSANGKASEAAARLTRSGSRYVQAVKSIRVGDDGGRFLRWQRCVPARSQGHGTPVAGNRAG